MSISEDMAALIAANREIAEATTAAYIAAIKASDAAAAEREALAQQRAAERAASAEAQADRRHAERMAADRKFQIDRLAGDREFQARMLAAFQSLHNEQGPMPDPLPVVQVDAPESLNDEQAGRYAALFADEFKGVPKYAGTDGAKLHWIENGQREWLANDPNRRRFTP